jgi:hypothetical protein
MISQVSNDDNQDVARAAFLRQGDLDSFSVCLDPD